MGTLVEEIAHLSPEQRRLLETRLRQKGIEISKFQILPRSEQREHYPLSFAQRRLWFLHQLDPRSSVYHISTPMHLRGDLDRVALGRALGTIVERHEALRTTFGAEAGEPVQVIHPETRQPLPAMDLTAIEKDLREDEVWRLVCEHVQRPFDLERGPLLRTCLIQISDDDHVFVPTMHHIVSDGWSLGVFFHELLVLYEAYSQGRPSPLAPLPIQYVDFALWQLARLQGEVYDNQLAYWKEQLAGIPPVLDLPLDRPRPPVQTFRGGVIRRRFPAPLTAALRALSREEGVTLFVTLLAAYQGLLQRITGQDHVVVGSPVANRNRQEIEGLIGFFVNTLVLSGDLSGNPTFRSLLGRIREVNAGANAHQDLPFEKLVDELSPKRNLQYTPLFQASLSFQNEPGADTRSQLKGLHATIEFGENPVSMFDLSIMLSDSPQKLLADLIYNSDLFDGPTALRLARRFEILLRGATADPDRRLSELPLLADVERHQLLAEWNEAPAAAASETGLDRLFSRRARRSPERPALAFEGREMSYGELDERTDRLGRRLRTLGVGPETLVGLYVARSPDIVIGILGILKAGGAYLPLDPSYPRERLAFMLRDSGTALVLSRRSLAEELPAGGLRVLHLDELPEDEPPAAPAPPASADHLAYVIYTSGSTGRPKGVQVTHRNVVRLFAATERRFGFGPDDVWTLFHSHAFDFSVWEIWGALLHGGRLVVVPYEVSRSPEDFHRLLADHGVTVLNQTPSAFRQLVETDAGAGRELALRWVIFGGEALDLAGLRQWFERHGDRRPRLTNMYGITETTVHVTERPLSAAAAARAHGSLIGRPLADLRCHLLDRFGQPVPLGSRGEICVGGAGVARGYLGRPGLTAERVVPDPFSEPPGQRLYRSGDLARALSSGELVYLGRRDHQVKVRGFRIELGEIEAGLLSSTAVREAVVTLREGRLVAYLVLAEEASVRELRAALGERLPEHMIPGAFVKLESLPLTRNGKVDRKALPAPETLEDARLDSGTAFVAPGSEAERTVAAIWQEVLEVERVGVRDNFFDLGGHSLLLIRVQQKLREAFQREISIVDLFRHPTVAALAESFDSGQGAAPQRPGEAGRRRETRTERSAAPGPNRGARSDVAIIGMTGRFPGARDLEEFWRNLRDGVESVSFFTEEEQLASGISRQLLDDPNYVRANAVLEGPELFDAPLFDITPREAQIIDPQQRLFLECAWEALENAGYAPQSYGGPVGVFAGVGINHYFVRLLSSPDFLAKLGYLPVTLGNAGDYLATRVSYKLDLKGPSFDVQTACSTSLVATHLACQSLFHEECRMALAGGVSVSNYHRAGYNYQEGGVASPDGHTRSFDARARGTVGGNGAGVVVLKRLADALADGDTVHAVIKGSAINNDGSSKLGFTAPSIEGQSRVIGEALKLAGVAPEDVGYVETHGTATPLGDPVEVAALKEVFGDRPGERCALGAVKTNIGHTDAAAGVAGLIKTVLCLEHGQIVPSLNFEEPNPEIDFENSPFYVNTRLADWPDAEDRRGLPRRAGVSSFGLGGTNAHVVLEEAPGPEPSGPSRPRQVLVLSAATGSALEAASDRLARHLGEHPEDNLADVAFTLQVGRRRLEHRRVLVCRGSAEAAEAIRKRHPERLLSGVERRTHRPVAFLFPGLGDHSLDMARELYGSEPVFRDELDRCAELLRPHLDGDLRETIYPEGEERPAAPPDGELDLRRLLGRGDETESPAARRLDRTRLAQPAVFAIELALAELWRSWGIVPEAMIGYSLGEYAAACLAGVLRREDALALVAFRARLIDDLPGGAMLAAPLSEQEVGPLLGADLSLAAVNGPRVSVVAGPADAVAALERQLASRDVACRRLRTTHAFHSAMMEPSVRALDERVRELELRPPRIPYLSNVTGTWITADEATDPRYWSRHMCRPVRFAPGLHELLRDAERILLEVGPGQALATSARQHPASLAEHVVLSSLGDPRDPRGSDEAMLTTLGRLWLAGAPVDWPGFQRHERRRRRPLPTYPFEHQRYFVEPETRPKERPRRGATAGGKTPDIADWFYLPSWRTTPPPARPDAEKLAEKPEPWLLFVDDHGLGSRLAVRLREHGQEVVLVRPDAGFSGLRDGAATVDPRRREDYEALFQALAEAGRPPRHLVHLWSVTDGVPEDFDEVQHRGLYSLFYAVRAMARQGMIGKLRLEVISTQLQDVEGREDLCPAKATMIGALKVIPQEYRNITCRSLDVTLPKPGSRREENLADHLFAELVQPPDPARGVAYRASGRWVERFEPLPLPAVPEPRPGLRRRGVYLLIGGFGKVGRVLSPYLARTLAARLVLTSRTPLPERGEWDGWRAAHGEDDPTSRRIAQVRSLEELGAEVLPLAAEASDSEQMAAVVEAARQRFGELHGVVYLAGTLAPERLHVSLEDAGPETCGWHFRPKVQGLEVLREVLRDADLDFCVLFSSVASVLGGLGFAAYAASNTYVDAFAERRARDGGFPWLSLGWDGWQESEEDVRQAEGLGAAMADLSMAPSESTEAFHRALSLAGQARVVVAVGDLEQRIGRWVHLSDAETTRTGEEGKAAAQKRHARPQLHTPYAAPTDDVEESIAELWQDLLGIEKVGIHDSFFDLGGDSLLGTQLISRLRQALHVELPMRVLFTASTVAQVAEVVREGEYRQEELSEIEKALREIQQLAAEQVAAELQEEAP